MIKALVFDFDGLILDTELSALQSWQEVYGGYSHDLPLEKWALCIGTGVEAFDPHTYLESLLGYTVPRDEIAPRRLQRHMELIATQAALPGVENYIQSAKRLGLKIAVASSSPRSWVVGHLTRLGLQNEFDAMKFGDEVIHKKPHPEIYLAALDLLGVSAEQAIALEDSPNGVLAAQRAGIFCVAIPNPVTGQLPLDHADLRLQSLADLPLEQLITLVENRHAAKIQA
ncbi:MAG: HAD family hydrolase [Ktedonobacteraceae bacterium]